MFLRAGVVAAASSLLAGCAPSVCWQGESSDQYRPEDAISSYAEDIASDSKGNLFAVGGAGLGMTGPYRWLVRRKLAAESGWTMVDEGPSGGVIAFSVAVDASDTVWVVGSVTGSPAHSEVRKSTDGGATWTSVASNLSAGRYGGQELAVEPQSQALLLAASYVSGTDGNGNPIGAGALLRSTDGGQTWTVQYDTASDGCASGTVRAVQAGSGGRVFIGGSCVSGGRQWVVWRSVDGGLTFTRTDETAFNGYGEAKAIALDRKSETVYVAGDGAGANGVTSLDWSFRKGTPAAGGELEWVSLATYDYDTLGALGGDHFVQDVLVDSAGDLLAVGSGEEEKPFSDANDDTPSHWVVARLPNGSPTEKWSPVSDYLLATSRPAGTTRDHGASAKGIAMTPKGQLWVAGQARDGTSFLSNFIVRKSCD